MSRYRTDWCIARRVFLTLLVLTLADAGSTAPFLRPLRVMTFNIRYATERDGENAWEHRKEYVASMIRFHKADAIGVQEALIGQIEYLQEQLPEYDWFGAGRDDGERAGEFCAVFYRADRLRVLRDSTFWLSETPENPGLGWDAACPRVVTWGRFFDLENEKIFYLFNTHFDHRGQQARIESAKRLCARVNETESEIPAIVCGDFNAEPNSAVYRILTQTGTGRVLIDARAAARYPHHGPEVTFTGFGRDLSPGKRIDYIFISGPLQVRYHGNLSDTFDGRPPSDHMPVLVECLFE